MQTFILILFLTGSILGIGSWFARPAKVPTGPALSEQTVPADQLYRLLPSQ